MLCLGIINGLYLFVGGMGLCVDLVVYIGYIIFFYYDSMIVKVIVYGENCFDVFMKM